MDGSGCTSFVLSYSFAAFWVSDPNYKSPALGSFYSLVLGTSLF